MPPAKQPAPRSPETRLAGIVAQLVTVLRRDADDFPLHYDNLKSALWACLADAERFAPFGSDFFADLLEVTRHPIAAADTVAVAVATLRRVELFLALRKLQAGDLDGALGVMRALAGLQAELQAVAPPPRWAEDSHEPVLTPERLAQLGAALEPGEPATAAIVRQLETLLRDDPTSTSGAAVNIMIHLTAVDPRLHPGYGLLMQVHSSAAALDRGMRTQVSLDGIQVAADGLTRTHAAADAVSRCSRGPRMDRGIDMRFFVEGPKGFVDGHSADLAYALLFASDGRSAGGRLQLVPYPGTAAMGELEADGLVLEVASGPLGPKLRRLCESGVRRLYLPESQATACHAILHALQAAPPHSRADTVEIGNGTSPAEPREDRWLTRRIALIPAARLVEIAQPPHFASELRTRREGLRRFVCRNRVRVEVAAAILAALVVALVVLFGPNQIADVKVHEDRISVRRGIVWRHSRKVEVPGGALRFIEPRGSRWWGDADGDGKEEIYVLSLHTSGAGGHSGRVRVDCFGGQLESRWHDYVDLDLRYGAGDTEYSLDEVSDVQAEFDDLDGDGKLDILAACKPGVWPSPLVVWDARGRQLLRYVHAGHIQDFCLVPVPFVPQGTLAAPSDRDWSRAKYIAALATAQEDSGCAVFLLPPWMGSGASPAKKTTFRHFGLPVPQTPYVRIPRTLAAIQVGTGKSNPDHIEYLTGERPHLKVCTLEVGGSGTLIRRLDAHLSQYQVQPTDEFLRLTKSVALDEVRLRESIETLPCYENGNWVTRRRTAWLR